MPTHSHEDRLEELRRSNTARCATHLRDHGPASVSELARATGLSRPTVEAALLDLGSRGLVTTDEANESRGVGRPARVSRFHGDAGYVAGIDIGISRIRVVIADLAGEVCAFKDDEDGVHTVGEARLAAISDLLDVALREAGVPRERLLIAHVGITGVVSLDGRLLVSHAFPDLQGIDIAGGLSAALGCPIELDNDVNLAAVGEQRLGAARRADDTLFFLIGKQVSAGLVLDGRLRRGRHSAAGELDAASIRIPLDENGHIIWRSAPTGREVFALAAAGDAAADAEIGAFIAGLADTILVLIQTIDPELVVIGGPVSQAGDRFVAALANAVDRLSSQPVLPRIVASRLGSASIAYGALARAFDRSSDLVYGISGVPMPEIRRADDRELSGEQKGAADAA